MPYPQRMAFAAIAAFLLHLAAIALVARLPRPQGPSIQMRLDQQPAIVLNLQPEPTQFVDVHTPAESPVQPTENIALFDSEATDRQSSDADTPGPRVDEVDDHNALAAAPSTNAGAPPAPAPEPEEQEQPAPRPEPQREARARPQKAVTPLRGSFETRERDEAPPMPIGAPGELAPERPREEVSPETKQVDVARAQVPPGSPGTPGDTRERLRGRHTTGVSRTGLAGFEAMRSEIAPYLKKVEEAVEREWKTAIALSYSGTKPTQAILHCDIRPDGSVSVDIIDDNNDVIFSRLCENAILKAGPFGPFPFEVPAMYRNKNLEIRWTFSFVTR